MGGGTHGFVVEEVEAATKTEGVFVRFVEGLALSLRPEVLWV